VDDKGTIVEHWCNQDTLGVALLKFSSPKFLEAHATTARLDFARGRLNVLWLLASDGTHFHCRPEAGRFVRAHTKPNVRFSTLRCVSGRRKCVPCVIEPDPVATDTLPRIVPKE
jgi:hypothetical protein